MDNTQIGLIVILVVALCEGVKQAGFLSSRWIPLLAVGLSLLGAYSFDGVNFLATSAGVIMGLSTTAGYALVKTTILNK